MIKKGIILCLVCLLVGCSLTPEPLSVDERYEQAQKDVKQLFAAQKKLPKKLDYYEALARALKYNLDYRIKLVNNALQAGQLKIAEFTMFPALNASGSIYSRNNTSASSGITTTGASTDILNSTPNTIRSARMGLSWNILDFGVGYVRAKQQGERVLIAEEESRKQIQQLSQDVLVAYWDAYSAQELMVKTKQFQALLTKTKNKLQAALHDETIPKENLLNYRAALLEGNRRLVQLKYKYDKAMLDLKHLLNLSPDDVFRLAPPPNGLMNMQNLRDLDFKKLDAITLVNRPELRGQNYQKIIAKIGVKTAILQALPGMTLNGGWNYNSNDFLLNRVWLDRSFDVAWNLLNLASLPTTYQTAKVQKKYEKLKLMALTLTVLTEIRYAYSHYQTLSDEYTLARQQTENANTLLKLNEDRQRASIASDQQVILAQLRSLTAKMDENLLLADLSTALGELYLSTGSDILPLDSIDKPLSEVIKLIKEKFILQDTLDFKHYVNITYEKMFGTQQPYTIQVFGSYDLDAVKNLQKQFSVKKSAYYGQTKHNGRNWYVLTYGGYTSAEEATTSINQLPTKIRQLTPWVRKTNELTWVA